MTGRVVWDGRWIGRHGIGRHAQEVGSRIQGLVDILEPGRVRPTSPADPFYLRATLHLGSDDLFVSPGFNASLPGAFRQLVTVHDLIHLKVDSESSFAKRAYYDRVVLPAIRSTKRVLTGSEFSRRELIKWTGLPPESVVASGYGCSIAVATRDELNCVSPESIRRILFVGNPKPHKNFRLLLSALRHLSDDITLTTVGLPRAYVTKACIREGVDSSRVSVFQGVSDETLRVLYATAACVALPSTYEGFGLAALEGMAVGTPTAYVCDAVAEVVGPLGYRAASATDGGAFAFALDDAISTGGAIRQELVKRAMMYSWDNSAAIVDRQIREMRA